MRRTAWRFVVAASFICVAGGATRPHYGGVLRVQMSARMATLDSSVRNNIGALVFDPLVSLSDTGKPQPALAASWKYDADLKRWEFQLRQGVKFHDGTPLTAGAAAIALESLGAAVHGDILLIRSDPSARLLQTLSGLGVWKRTAEGGLTGTGPFRMVKFEASQRVVVTANDEYWGGRPYLDGVEIEMGRSLREQGLDFDLNKADLVELGVGDARRITQTGKRVWTSLPIDLLALVFDAAVDERVREAIALSIDRATIHSVLLQKQGAPAGSILPQWLSGYAFLFPANRDLDRARQLAAHAAPVTLAYAAGDGITRLIAERIAVNARETGLVIRPVADGPANARITRSRIASPDVGSALGGALSAAVASGSPEAMYAAERAFLQERRFVPLFHLPEILGLVQRVKGWAPSRWSGWKLDSVWLAP